MKTLIRPFAYSIMLSLVFILGLSEVPAQKSRPVIKRGTVTKRTAQARTFTIAAGKRVHARMNDNLSSKTSRVGDTFTVTVTEPVYSDTGAVVIPSGSEMTGRVNSVTPARKGGDPGQIDVSFNQLKLPNGMSRRINGSLTDLQSDDAKSDAEGTASGDKMKHRKIIFIGGGGVGGAVLGGAIGGGKGALIGGLLGAGAGLLGERFTKGEEAEVRSGSEFGVILNQSVSLPRFAETGSDADNEYVGAPTPGGQTYVVRRGDTLAKISIRFYGTSSRYRDIYEANRDRLASPSSIEVGQTLVIP
ncbi:MAG: LysM peptidoglycan-binding domain-containing protein [Acidobacteriota bacterium]